MVKRRQRLLQQVADEFRADQIRTKLYKGSLEQVIVQGRAVTKNYSVQMAVFACLKRAIKPQLEVRLQQTLKAKN